MPIERIDRSPYYPGQVEYFSCLVLPSKFLVPDGRAISRSLYPRLFDAYVNTQQARVTLNSATMICADSSLFAIGCLIAGSSVPAGTRVTGKSGTSVTMSANATATTSIQNYTFHLHGLGDGSTTFNLPDYRGRALIDDGQGTSLTNRLLGASGGAETVSLTSAQNGQHSHPATPNAYFATYGSPNLGSERIASGGTGNATAGNPTTADSGSGLPHENMMPFSVVQLGIFAG